MNVTLYPTGIQHQGGGANSSTPEGTEEGDGTQTGHPIGGGITVDPRCKPTSPMAVASSSAGVYMESLGGAVSSVVQVEPGEYVAFVSSFSPQEADFLLTVFSAPALPDVQRLV